MREETQAPTAKSASSCWNVIVAIGPVTTSVATGPVADGALLAETDTLHDTLSGPAPST
jgi:hypothetical protein